MTKNVTMVLTKTKEGLLFWLGDEPSPDGLPVYSKADIEFIRRTKELWRTELLNGLYKAKMVNSITAEAYLAEVKSEPPFQEIGYEEKRPSSERERLAREWGPRIRELIQGQTVKTLKSEEVHDKSEPLGEKN